MDTPPFIHRIIYRAPGRQALVRATLGYCGVRTARMLTFGPVITSGAVPRDDWLVRAREVGSRLKYGVLSPGQRHPQRLSAWLAALRLQVYLMTWIAYTVGALVASLGKSMSMTTYLLGYVPLFLVETTTVFLNE